WVSTNSHSWLGSDNAVPGGVGSWALDPFGPGERVTLSRGLVNRQVSKQLNAASPMLPGVEPLMLSRSMSYNGRERCEEINVRGDVETSDDEGSQLGEKENRSNLEQMKALEKSFELGNKEHDCIL
nr:leucine zipper, homeobox-associated, homeodomain-like protein [Tanacetum cinerariifolium]